MRDVPISSVSPPPDGSIPPVPGGLPPHTPTPAPRPAVEPGLHHLSKAVIIKWAFSIAVPLLFVLVVSGMPTLEEITAHAQASGSSSLGIVVIAIAIVVVCLLLGALIAWLSYRNFTWEITETELHVNRGIIFKHRSQIPFSRLHAIDAQAKVLDRILGIVTLNVQTAGSSTPEAVIAGLTLSDAEALRSEVFSRKRAIEYGDDADILETARRSAEDAQQAMGRRAAVTGQASDVMGELGRTSSSFRGIFGGSSGVDDDPVTFEYALTTKEVFLAAVSGDSTVAMLFSLIIFILSTLGSLGIDVGDVSQGVSSVAGSSPLLVPMLVVIIIVIFLVLWLITLAGVMLSIGGFTVRCRADRLEVEQGLLQHRFNGIALSRVQSVVVRRGLIRRALGYAEVVVSTASNMSGAGEGNDAHRGMVIHPFIRYTDVPAFIKATLPEFADVPTDLKPLPRVARRRAINRDAIWPFLFIGIIVLIAYRALFPGLSSFLGGSVFLAIFLTAFVVLFLLQLIRALLWFKHARFTHNAKMLVLQKGAFNMELICIPRRKIQWAQASENPFQHLAGVETIRAVTAAGERGTRNTLRDVIAEDADDILDWVRPGYGLRGNRGR